MGAYRGLPSRPLQLDGDIDRIVHRDHIRGDVCRDGEIGVVHPGQGDGALDTIHAATTLQVPVAAGL